MSWVPALGEQALIAYAVANCEANKYSNSPDPKNMPKAYLSACIKAESKKELIGLTEKYNLKFHKNGEIRLSFTRFLKLLNGLNIINQKGELK